MKTHIHKIYDKVGIKSDRTKNITKHVLLSFIYKGCNILIGLILVPLTINYISNVQYGIWLTISSIISWMSFFDVGMGHGLRNKLANAIALGNFENAKKYVSTTYAVLTIIALVMLVFFVLINPLINWRVFLNIPSTVPENIQFIVLIVMCSFCVQFVVTLINTILNAVHEPSVSGLISFISQLILLIIILILKHFVAGSLELLVWALTLTPILTSLVTSIILFGTKLKNIAPSRSFVDFNYVKDILNIGGTFFIIQIGALVLFQTNNIIITKIIGPEAVTEFNVGYKLFTVASMMFVIIATPYWSAYTEAYTKNEFDWMKNNIKTLRKIWLLLSFLVVVLLMLAPFIYKFWLGDSVIVSKTLSVACAVYVIIYMWQTMHVFLINGIGKLKLQLILVIISAIVNMPLAIWLGKKYGAAGVLSANTIVFLFMGIIFYFQTELIINNKAKGIWAK